MKSDRKVHPKNLELTSHQTAGLLQVPSCTGSRGTLRSLLLSSKPHLDYPLALLLFAIANHIHKIFRSKRICVS